jgi:hypothetical protein
MKLAIQLVQLRHLDREFHNWDYETRDPVSAVALDLRGGGCLLRLLLNNVFVDLERDVAVE